MQSNDDEPRTTTATETAIGTHGITATDPAGEVRDENGMTSDDRFDQLEDETRVVTSGLGSRLPLHDSEDGTSETGYSAGVSSGDGSD